MDKTKIKHGDILLFHSKGFSLFSIGIRSLTQSFWNHTGMIISENNVFYVIEALGKGVVKTPLEKYLDNKGYILKVVRLRPGAFKDKEEYDEGIITATQKMISFIGLEYDWGAIFWLGIKYSTKAFCDRWIKRIFKKTNPLQNRERFFCSEVVCQSCLGISSVVKRLFAGTHYPEAGCSLITPKDISKSSNCQYILGENKI